MKERLVSFKTAKLAKEKGFSLGTNGMYCQYTKDYVYDEDPSHPESHKKGEIGVYYHYYKNDDDPNFYEIPTLSLLQMWLREKHQIIVTINTDCTAEPKYVYEINVFKGNPRNLSEKEWGWYFHKQENWGLYYTYEDALEEGLKEALNLIGKELEFK